MTEWQQSALLILLTNYLPKFDASDGRAAGTAEVYAWAARNRGRVFPAQGVHAPATPVSYAPQEYFPGPRGERLRIPGGILLHRIHTTLFKGTLANRLSISPGDPGTFWLHGDPDSLQAYAKEMCAEVWNPEKNLWDNPHGRANHAWDCEYLLQALAWMLNIAKKQRPGATKAAKTPRPVSRPQPARSAADKLGTFLRR